MNQANPREIRNFGIGILAGLAGLVGGLVAVGATIAHVAPESMPAPAISSLVHIDEKLRFVRTHPTIDPTILAVGSSITWRQLDGQPFEKLAGGPGRFLNGGTALLQVHQTQKMARFYLDHFPNVEILLVMVNLPDFGNCTSEPENLLEPEDAARYAFDDWPSAYFYFRYVSPQRYVRTAMTLAERRTPLRGDLYLDDYGSGPLEVPETMKRGLRYGELNRDPACVTALHRLVTDTKAWGVKLILVFSPVHPEYRERYAADIRWLADIAARLAAEAKRHSDTIIVLDKIDSPSFKDEDFFDAFHLQWKAVKVLSAQITGSPEAAPALRRAGQIAESNGGHASKGGQLAF